MYYKVYLIYFILSLVVAQTALAADSSRYRVELIVFAHLQHDAAPLDVKRLQDYSAALDFLAPASADDEQEPAGTDDAAASGRQNDALDADSVEAPGEQPGAPTDPAENDLPQGTVHLPELGEQMQEAWRRLRLSGPFRPLQFLAWEQSGAAPFPSLRLHDLEIVLTEDPWADARVAHHASINPGVDTPDGAVAAGEPLPPPAHYYRLDGTATLTRSRFLHLALALELRDPVWPEAASPSAPPPLRDGGGQPAPAAFLVHRLEQSRVVHTGRMEYFDGPVLGVLAWVTDVSEAAAVQPPQPGTEQP